MYNKMLLLCIAICLAALLFLGFIEFYYFANE